MVVEDFRFPVLEYDSPDVSVASVRRPAMTDATVGVRSVRLQPDGTVERAMFQSVKEMIEAPSSRRRPC